jgi:hypothetical protein
MNSNSREKQKVEIWKAESGKRTRLRAEATARQGGQGAPEWWTAVPEGEKTLLHAVGRMLRGAKRSQLQEVARAAAKWERGIGCFIKVRLMHERRPRRVIDSGWVRIEGRGEKLKSGKLKGEIGTSLTAENPRNPEVATSCPSDGHSQPGAFPNPG